MCVSRRLLLAMAVVVGGANFALAESPYAIRGTITDIDTGNPIANATVRVFVEAADPPIREGVSGSDGKYVIVLPAGHVYSSQIIESPPGYCVLDQTDRGTFATSDQMPVMTRDFQLKKGVIVNVAVQTDRATLPPTTRIALVRREPYWSSWCELKDMKSGTVTISETVGKLAISCGDVYRHVTASDSMSVEFERGFDPNKVKSVTKHQSGLLLITDTSGRIAKLAGCSAKIHDQVLSIVIDVQVANPEDAGELHGRIVDSTNDPIGGATVELTFHSGGGSSASGITAKADTTGSFQIPVPPLLPSQKVGLIVTKDGFAGLDTEPIELTARGSIDVGTIKLDAQSSVRLRVVDHDGAPLHGAVVEPLQDYASRLRTARTDRQGECTLIGLRAGVPPVEVRFGALVVNTKIPLDRGENEVVVIRMASIERRAEAAPDSQPPLAAGAPAPEWDIVAWTDGQERELADYRGRVVVLDFWGVWCGPCIQSIPAMKQLHERFKHKDVVFIGIHTAGTDMDHVKRLIRHEKWDDNVTGLDEGADVNSGKTVRSFAVQGFPTVIVIDANGRVAFNSGDVKDRETYMRNVQAVAETAGLQWPPDENATEEQIRDTLARLQIAWFSREIENALLIRPE